MSQENIETLVRLGQAFNEEGWNGIFAFVAPEFEFHEPPEQPGATVFYGIEAARKGTARWAEAWTEQTSEVQDFRLLPDGRILVLTLERMRGRDGIAVEQEQGTVFTFKDGKVLRMQCFWDQSKAFEAAGLSE
jgi:ketosteroid isomerase-like protein